MENEVIEKVVKQTSFSKMPKWLKTILIILSILTLVYWVGFVVIKILSALRFILQEISKKEHWWFFIVTMLIVGIVALLLSQFVFGLDPFGKLASWCCGIFDSLKDSFIDWILTWR